MVACSTAVVGCRVLSVRARLLMVPGAEYRVVSGVLGYGNATLRCLEIPEVYGVRFRVPPTLGCCWVSGTGHALRDTI